MSESRDAELNDGESEYPATMDAEIERLGFI